MTIAKFESMPIMLRDMRLDDVDGGIPRLTITRPEDGSTQTYYLAPDAVRALVDTLCGVAEVGKGEARIIVKVNAEDVAAAIGALVPLRPAPGLRVTDEPPPADAFVIEGRSA